MLLESVDEAYHHEVEAWLENAEKEFERIAEATGWPIAQIRDFYKGIGSEIGQGEREGKENIYKPKP